MTPIGPEPARPRWARPLAALLVASCAPFLVATARWWLGNSPGLVAFSMSMPVAAGAGALLAIRQQRRQGRPVTTRTAAGPGRRPLVGLAFVALGLAILAPTAAEPVLGAVGLWLAWAGAVGLWLEPAWSARLAVPLAPLALMAPLTWGLPGRVEAFLQRASAVSAELWLTALSVPVVRDGVVLHTPGYSNSVDDTCSGLSTAASLLVYTALLGTLLRVPRRRLLAVALLVGPLTVVANGGRIAWVSILGERGGTALALGALHEVSGYVTFGVSWLVLLGLLVWLRRRPRAQGANGVAAAKQSASEMGPRR